MKNLISKLGPAKGNPRYASLPIFKLFSWSILTTLLLFSCNNGDELRPEPIVTGDVTLLTQADVDDFGLTGVKEISGNLIIGERFGLEASDLSSLTPLIGLEEIGGDLRIFSTALTNLQGLNDLKRINGDLEIHGNDELQALDHMAGLQQINGIFTFSFNPNIHNLSAFDGLSGVGIFRIRQNNSLESLFDMQNNELARIEISNNPNLETLPGIFPKQIASLTISANNRLVSLKGLENTAQINRLRLWTNEGLTSLEGLENLKHVPDTMEIRSNSQLINFDGMGMLETGPEYVDITNNRKLRSIDRFKIRSESKGAFVAIIGNWELQGLEPLLGLETMELLTLSGNFELTNIRDLRDLKELMSLQIAGHFELASLEGLENLESVDNLYIDGNDLLTNLNALSGLGEVAKRLVIKRNTALTDLCAIQSLISSGGPETLEMENNAFNQSRDDFLTGNCSN